MSTWNEATEQCRDVQRMIWADGPDGAPDYHLATCRACAEEARRAADLLAALAGMQERVAIPPLSLEPILIAQATRSRVDRARDFVGNPRFWRGAAVGAAAATAAATAAFGLIAARRATRPEVA